MYFKFDDLIFFFFNVKTQINFIILIYLGILSITFMKWEYRLECVNYKHLLNNGLK